MKLFMKIQLRQEILQKVLCFDVLNYQIQKKFFFLFFFKSFSPVTSTYKLFKKKFLKKSFIKEPLQSYKIFQREWFPLTWASCLTSLTSFPSSAMSLSRCVQNLSMLASLSVSDLSIAFLTPVMLGFRVWKIHSTVSTELLRLHSKVCKISKYYEYWKFPSLHSKVCKNQSTVYT